MKRPLLLLLVFLAIAGTGMIVASVVTRDLRFALSTAAVLLGVLLFTWGIRTAAMVHARRIPP